MKLNWGSFLHNSTTFWSSYVFFFGSIIYSLWLVPSNPTPVMPISMATISHSEVTMSIVTGPASPCDWCIVTWRRCSFGNAVARGIHTSPSCRADWRWSTASTPRFILYTFVLLQDLMTTVTSNMVKNQQKCQSKSTLHYKLCCWSITHDRLTGWTGTLKTTCIASNLL